LRRARSAPRAEREAPAEAAASMSPAGEAGSADAAGAVPRPRAERKPRKEGGAAPADAAGRGPRRNGRKDEQKAPGKRAGASRKAGADADDIFSFVTSESFDTQQADEAIGGRTRQAGKSARRDLTADDDAPKLHKV